MKKFIIVTSFLFIAIIAMAYLYFSNLKRSENANDLSLTAVSATAPLVFSFEHDASFYDILNGQDILQHVLGNAKISQLQLLDTFRIGNRELDDFLQGQRVYVGLLAGQENKIDFLVCTQIKENVALKDLLKAKLPTGIQMTIENELITLRTADSVSIYMGMKDKLFALSGDAKTVSLALANGVTPNAFTQYIKQNNGSTKNTLATLHLNFSALPDLLKNVLHTPLNGELAVIAQQDTYATLSYSFSNEKLLLNGQTLVGSDKSYFKLFDELPGQAVTINTLLPKNTANYTIYTITDYAKWYESLEKWLAGEKKQEQLRKNEAAISQKYGLDLKKIFPVYFKKELATFQLATGEKFGAIALSNGDKVGQLLLDLSADYAPDIKIFREANLPYAYFGEPFKKFEKPYYTIIDNFLVMANHASSIQVFLNSYRNNALLIHESGYQELSNQLTNATISFYINHKNSNSLFSRNLKAPYFNHYQATEGLNVFDAFALQLSGDKGKFITNLLLLKKQALTMQADTATN